MNRTAFLIAILLLVSLACRAQQIITTPTGLPTPSATITQAVQTPTARPTAPPTATRLPATRTPSLQSQTSPTAATSIKAAPFACAASPRTEQILGQTSAGQWLDWVEKLSGAEPVQINGEQTTIKTRYSPAMFEDGQPNALTYVLETIAQWYPAEQIEVMDYTVRDSEGNSYTWQNLILTLPGGQKADEVVILSAHLDSTSEDDPFVLAPGAEDNASGSAALLEAARLFTDVQFARTLRIIWFTGEEQGLLGSDRYVKRLENPNEVVGVLNLDMFGYDSDNDACFEMHVGELPQSDAIGQCFVQSIDAYDLPLQRYDYLTDLATDRSDHGSFWEAEIGAVEILENMGNEGLANGCPNGDMNENYHSDGDTVEKLNPQSGLWIVRAALATIAGMAEIQH